MTKPPQALREDDEGTIATCATVFPDGFFPLPLSVMWQSYFPPGCQVTISQGSLQGVVRHVGIDFSSLTRDNCYLVQMIVDGYQKLETFGEDDIQFSPSTPVFIRLADQDDLAKGIVLGTEPAQDEDTCARYMVLLSEDYSDDDDREERIHDCPPRVCYNVPPWDLAFRSRSSNWTMKCYDDLWEQHPLKQTPTLSTQDTDTTFYNSSDSCDHSAKSTSLDDHYSSLYDEEMERQLLHTSSGSYHSSRDKSDFEKHTTDSSTVAMHDILRCDTSLDATTVRLLWPGRLNKADGDRDIVVPEPSVDMSNFSDEFSHCHVKVLGKAEHSGPSMKNNAVAQVAHKTQMLHIEKKCSNDNREDQQSTISWGTIEKRRSGVSEMKETFQECSNRSDSKEEATSKRQPVVCISRESTHRDVGHLSRSHKYDTESKHSNDNRDDQQSIISWGAIEEHCTSVSEKKESFEVYQCSDESGSKEEATSKKEFFVCISTESADKDVADVSRSNGAEEKPRFKVIVDCSRNKETTEEYEVEINTAASDSNEEDRNGHSFLEPFNADLDGDKESNDCRPTIEEEKGGNRLESVTAGIAKQGDGFVGKRGSPGKSVTTGQKNVATTFGDGKIKAQKKVHQGCQFEDKKASDRSGDSKCNEADKLRRTWEEMFGGSVEQAIHKKKIEKEQRRSRMKKSWKPAKQHNWSWDFFGSTDTQDKAETTASTIHKIDDAKFKATKEHNNEKNFSNNNRTKGQNKDRQFRGPLEDARSDLKELEARKSGASALSNDAEAMIHMGGEFSRMHTFDEIEGNAMKDISFKHKPGRETVELGESRLLDDNGCETTNQEGGKMGQVKRDNNFRHTSKPGLKTVSLSETLLLDRKGREKTNRDRDGVGNYVYDGVQLDFDTLYNLPLEELVHLMDKYIACYGKDSHADHVRRGIERIRAIIAERSNTDLLSI